MKAAAPALDAMCATKFRYARAVPRLNQPPCTCRIAAPLCGRAGFAQNPEIPPTVSASKVTSVGTATRSMSSSNGPRAAVPASLPLYAATLARSAVAPGESSRLSGCTASQVGFAASAGTGFSFLPHVDTDGLGHLRNFREVPLDDLECVLR